MTYAYPPLKKGGRGDSGDISSPAPAETPSTPPSETGRVRWAFRTLLITGLLLFQPLPAFATLPPFGAVRATHAPSEAWLLDRHGAVIQTVRVNDKVRRLPWVQLSELSPAMTAALLVSEDKRFMAHAGVDWRAVASAMWDNLSGASHRGASTLTMQLAGLLDPDLNRPPGGRSLGQKWDQMKEARALEKTWSKAQILEAYLNRVNFRGELSGIHAAAQGLFHKHPSGLNKAEASLLAALLRGPNADPGVVGTRACGVVEQLPKPQPTCAQVQRLARMALSGPPRIEVEPQLAPHFARQFITRLSNPLGGGTSLRTSLDASLQRIATEALQRHLVELQGREVEDGAVVVLDNNSGEILAYVGASGLTSLSPEVDGVTAPRLPGSALKPFLYGLAIEQGLLTAASPLEDSPLALDTPTGQYVPQNYERDFKGWVSVRTALGASLNVPAVRTLLLLGEERFLQRLKDLGLATLKEDADFYGYALALGGGEVTLMDLANAYRALANDGLLKSVSWLPKSPLASKGRRVMSKPTTYIIGDILADKSARALTFGLDSPLETRGWAAVKTGTSKDMRDNWCLGYSPRYTVGVWVGNASGAPMHDVSGITGAAPVWQTVMNALQGEQPATAPDLPKGVERHLIRYEPPFEPERQEVFLSGTGQEVFTLPQAQERQSHIEGPGNGAVLALDPDIPTERQKVVFRAAPSKVGLRSREIISWTNMGVLAGCDARRLARGMAIPCKRQATPQRARQGGQIVRVIVSRLLSWQVDGTAPDPAWLQPDGTLLWPPQRGAHRFTLHAQDGKTLDAVFLTVK